MKSLKALTTIVILLAFLTPVMAKDTGDLQVTCKPGIRIYLDNSFAGTTNQKEDGLYIQDIEPGRHEVRAEKVDYLPQVFTVTIEAGRAVEIKIGEFPPKPKIRQEGKSDEGEIKTKVGKVIVTSIPLRCQISFLGDNIDKEKDQVIIEGIPIGKYPIAFRRDNDVLRGEADIESDVTLNIQGDFKQGKVVIEKIATSTEKTNETSEEKPPEAKSLDIKNEIIGKDGMTMVLIPAGEFLMGSDGAYDNEKPIHTVYLDAFYVDKYEVTNEQYRKFIDATGNKAPGYWDDPDYNAPNQPVVGVSWNDAKAYADWAGKRLPTEAEWEKASKGGLVGMEYPWGDTLTSDDANYYGIAGKDQWKHTSPVGSFLPNGYGLYDMAGNVYEWCADWYDNTYYDSSAKSNPTGPGSGSYRVLRGGSWCNNGQSSLRVSCRNFDDPTGMGDNVGFRCVGLK